MCDLNNLTSSEEALARDCLERAREFAVDELFQNIDSNYELAHIGAEYGVFDEYEIELVNRYLMESK